MYKEYVPCAYMHGRKSWTTSTKLDISTTVKPQDIGRTLVENGN
jgi:hypothetical protein